MAALPAYAELQFSGFSQQDTSIIERSEVERGPAKTRRTATDPMVTDNGTLFFRTRAAIAAFRAWFYSPSGANAGAAWLDWTDPRTDTVRQIRFVSMGALTPLAGKFAIAQQPVVFEYLETVEQIAADGPRRWDFVSGVEGWQAFGGFSTIAWSAGFLQVRPITTKYAIVESPPAIAVRGGLYKKVRAGIKRVAGTGWAGNLFYSTAAHGEDFAYRKNIADPLPTIGVTVPVEWDLASLTAGGSDWLSSTITSIRIDLGGSDVDQFDIDWIEIVAP